MLKRIITGAVIGVLLFGLIYFSGTWVLPIMVALLSVIAVWEMGHCIGINKNLTLFIPSLLIAAALPIMAKVIEDMKSTIWGSFFVFYALIVFYFACSIFSKDKIKIKEAVTTFATTFYVVVGFTSLVLLRKVTYGEYILLFAVAAPWVCDIGAYFMGYFFGKNKLIPEISPKKTVEGAIGGTLVCTLACIFYGYIITLINPSVTVDYTVLLLVGVVVSIISQIGDLIASVIKREYGIKDYGNILPGHGGIMDRFDSVLLVAPFVLMILILPFGFSIFM